MSTLRRRDLAALLTAGGLLVGAACTARTGPVPTSPDIDRDPLADLDPRVWSARSGPELLELPLDDAGTDLEAWTRLGSDEAVLRPARGQLVDFLTTAYLEPEQLRALDEEAVRERVAAVAPSFWLDGLDSSWDAGDRYFYALHLAESFRSVGRPAIAASWLRGEEGGDPLLMLGGTIAVTVLETSTRAVGVIAYRIGIVATLDADASLTDAGLRVTVHGLDGCATYDGGGLLVPALEDTETHRAAQEHTLDTVIGAPEVGREALEDPDSALLQGDQESNALCE